VRFYGTSVLLGQASISRNTIVIGPVIIEAGVTVGAGATVLPGVVSETVGDGALWQGDEFGSERRIKRPLRLKSKTVAEPKSSTSLLWGTALAILLAVFCWSYAEVIQGVWGIWMRSDEYSSGLLVPFLAAYVIWSRREDLAEVQIQPALMWGSLVLLMALVARFMGLYYMYQSVERISLVLVIWALVMWFAGKRVVLKTAGVLLFLFLMLPLPNRVQSAITLPLQQWSTVSAVFCLETVGYSVERKGHIIEIGDTSVAVAEACNGLRMITAFFVIGALVVLLARRPWWEKVIILASCLPIALICNTVRLTVTAAVFTVLSGEHWEQLFHDFGGYAMMPLALGLIVLELFLLERMFTTDEGSDERCVIVRTR
ncbi:exosortase, partial [Planctomycetota bacterium]